MPIKGLTDKNSITPRFPRIGKLRKGGEKESANKPGPELDHWRFSSDRKEAEAAFVAAYGATPAMINVYLPYATVEENFQTWKEAWKAGGLDHRCDGEVCVIWLGSDGKYHREPKPCPGGCKEVGRLEIIIPEMLQAGHIGTVTMETHSLNDLISISETLTRTQELRGDNPLGLRGILFSLRRVPEKISVPGFGQNAGKRQRVEKWLVKIEPAVDWVQAQMALTRTDAYALEMDSESDVIDAPPVTVITESPAPTMTEEQVTGWMEAQKNAPEPEAPKVEAPADLPQKWSDFFRRAITELGYSDMMHVLSTVRLESGDQAAMPYRTAGPQAGQMVDAPATWAQLVSHKLRADEDGIQF